LVFYVSLLKKAPNRIAISKEELVPKEELDVYKVKKLLDSKINKKGKVEYLVK
jgi:hypothetical protein